MELFSPSLINGKILQYIEKINNIESLSDNCKKKLSKVTEQIIFIVKERCRSFNSVDKKYKDSPDQFNVEYEDPLDECAEMKELTYDFIHLVVYLEYLIMLYTELESKKLSETDKIYAIERCVSSIQCPDDIMTEPIYDVFSKVEYGDDD